MIAIIVISLLALIGAVFTVFVWPRKPSDANDQPVNPAPHFQIGLFDRTAEALLVEKQQENIASNMQRLLERAKNGDLDALTEAHSTHNQVLYAKTLDALIEWASSRQENLMALVSHVSKNKEIRGNKQLAQLFIDTSKPALDRRLTIEMIHIAALSNDSETYMSAVEATVETWRSGKLAGFTPDELSELLVSQYWVIAPEARRGGPGFALKRRLLNIRRELATTRSAH